MNTGAHVRRYSRKTVRLSGWTPIYDCHSRRSLFPHYTLSQPDICFVLRCVCMNVTMQSHLHARNTYTAPYQRIDRWSRQGCLCMSYRYIYIYIYIYGLLYCRLFVSVQSQHWRVYVYTFAGVAWNQRGHSSAVERGIVHRRGLESQIIRAKGTLRGHPPRVFAYVTHKYIHMHTYIQACMYISG